MSSTTTKAIVSTVSDFLAKAISDEDAPERQMHLCGTGAVALVEEKLKRHYGVKHALCVSNATTGLLAVAYALNLKNSEIVTTPYTYGGSIASWLLLGNRPRFADIDRHTLSLDVSAARRAITRKTKALLAVDVLGNPSDTTALRKLADEYGLWYVADAAQSFGAERDGRPASSLADVWVVSFTTGKTLFAGEGGAVLTNNTELYQRLVWHTQHPTRQIKVLGPSFFNEFAINARIHPLAAVWAAAAFDESLAQLRRYQEKCFDFIEALNEIGLTTPVSFKSEGIKPSFFRISVAWKRRERAAALLSALHLRQYTARIMPMPIALLYQQAAFIAKLRHRYDVVSGCKQAERQSKIRFCIAV
jgi:dTDP-4-amino-4,6-dideoxygalactose transaminase